MPTPLSRITREAGAFPVRTAIALAVLGLGLMACSEGAEPQEQSAAGGQAMPVDTVTAAYSTVELDQSLSGRARAYRIAEIRPQVTGLVEERIFEEGQYVEAGDPLYRIEDTDYRAAVASAEASLARARASATTARQTAERFASLVESNAVSRQQADEAAAAAAQAEAEVAMQRAQLDQARTNLDRTVIQAPIDGNIGRSSVTPGALVTQNQASALATVRQLDPIYIDLTMASADTLKWKGMMRDQGTDSLPVTVTLEDGSVYPLQGELEFSEVSVDESAGTVVVRARLDNPDGLILPGMFVRASLPVDTVEQAVLVPQAAVMRTPRGEPYVLAISPESTAEQRLLTVTGQTEGNWIVTAGLTPGDQVITSRLQMLQPGAPVMPMSQMQQQQQGGAQSVANASH